MFFKNNYYNLLLCVFLFFFSILVIVIFIGNYEKIEPEERLEKGKHMKYILGFLGLFGVMYMIIKNMNKGVVKIFGMNMERGLIIYIFMCFLLAFAF